jgi:hypothetical protein
MEIAILGEGEVVIRFIDSKGRTLIQEKVGVFGSPTVEARRTIALSVETTGGAVPLSPVLVRQSNPKQHVTFDGEPPSRFTRKRSEAIGCPIDVVNDAERGCAAPASQGHGSVLLSDDQALARLIQKAARGKADPSESES